MLTTGLQLEKEPEVTASFVRSLEEASAAGLIVELVGARNRSLAALQAAANSCALPVIVVERRVRFVEVTEVVHRMIVAEQLERVERRPRRPRGLHGAEPGERRDRNAWWRRLPG